jgi:hypothetical protein
MALMGAGLVLSGCVAWIVAATGVVLPYDEALTGLSRARLAATDAHLLGFMAHDRVTFAGALISVGVLYVYLALYEVSQGRAWAWRTLLVSSSIGFATFFLWLGFGYLDPLHALATALLFICFATGVFLRLRESRGDATPGGPVRGGALRAYLRGGTWRAAWREVPRGQALFILIGVGMAVAGLVIAGIGATTVFVPEDLTFLGTTPAALHAVSPRLVPLIAHDRAGVGGALLASGVGVALLALWGYRRGARELWWAFVGAGVPGFVAALGVHFAVGYVNWWHLFPGFVALGLYLVGLAVAYPELCGPPPLTRRWIARYRAWHNVLRAHPVRP